MPRLPAPRPPRRASGCLRPVFVTHSAAYDMYALGQTAPETIWRIAEGGDRSFLLNEVNALVGSSV